FFTAACEIRCSWFSAIARRASYSIPSISRAFSNRLTIPKKSTTAPLSGSKSSVGRLSRLSVIKTSQTEFAITSDQSLQLRMRLRAAKQGRPKMSANQCDIGLIGLAVMGENLVLNMESKGFSVAVFNRTTEVTEKFAASRAKGKNIRPTKTVDELVTVLKRPRKIMIM